MSDKNELVEKIASNLYGECFVPAKEPFGDSNAALLCAAMAEQIIGACESHLKQQLEQRVVEAIDKKIFKYPNCHETRTRNDVMREAIEAVREVFKADP